LYVHYLRFSVECFRRKGVEFQSFFEQIMGKADPSFIAVKPSGKEGDWKNDGYSGATRTVFQVYAPLEVTVAATVAKIKEDFEGAKLRWKGKMDGWTFVWSAEKALPPQVLAALLDIKNDNGDLTIENWGQERLWQMVEGLDESDRVELFGPLPQLETATTVVVQVTAAEVQTLLHYLVDVKDGFEIDDDLSLIALRDKMDRNQFSSAVRSVIDGGLPLLGTVGYYVNKSPDERFSQRVSLALSAAYEELRQTFEGDADKIFFGLLARIAPEAGPDRKEYWAAVAIVDFYFELCDIFEK